MAVDPWPATIWCVGVPLPQGSKTGYIMGKGDEARVVIQDGSSKARRDGTNSRAEQKKWRAIVAAEADAWCKAVEHLTPWDGPASVDVTFWLPRPRSAPRWKWLPDKKPDIDKLVRSVLDSITGNILSGDSRVTDLQARKRYVPEGHTAGCRVIVRPLPERDVGPDVYSWSAMYPAEA